MKKQIQLGSEADNILDLPHELLRFVSDNNHYKFHHNKIPADDSDSLLREFLLATLDEVRLHYADRYANSVLKITDLEDSRHFRQGVLRREATNDIEFQRQRDHAAHTLHNYLLGWYIYENSIPMRNAMCKAVAIRLAPSQDNPSEREGLDTFANLWPFVSLLHDIGYLFEGGLDVLRTDVHNERVQRGAEVAQEYFRNRFWHETPMAAASERARVREWTGITEPDFSPFTITAVGDSLRALGNLEPLWKCVRADLTKLDLSKTAFSKMDFNGQGDAFDVWRRHYRIYSPPMEKRVDRLEKAFYAMIWDGLPGIGLRILDHGVSGGLLQLLYSTYYFQLHFGIETRAKARRCPAELIDLRARIRKHLDEIGVVYHAYWWWTSIVWATAATALHNLQQMDQPWPGYQTLTDPLALDEDPLAYLGILVDIMQEWDRYTVSRTSIFTGKLPLQGKDVTLSANKGLVSVNYGDAARAKKVRESLNTALEGWERIVMILPAI